MVSLNMLDYLLVLVIVAGAMWGTLQGVGKLLIGILCLYVAMVVSLLLYLPLGRFFGKLVPAFSSVGAQALAFVLILFVVYSGLTIVARFVASPAEERRRRQQQILRTTGVEEERRPLNRYLVGPLKTVVNFAIGLLVATMWLSLALAVVQFVVLSQMPVGLSGASLRQQISSSALLPMFNVALYLLYRSVSIWLPSGDIPIVFARILHP
jgi:hypothetical protein